jgi:ribosomal protein S7
LKNTKNKKRKNIKYENTILENYINTINIGFDNGKKYDNYNIINKEKDEDSDNENDKLECEPVPSFLLCIQKMKKNET